MIFSFMMIIIMKVVVRPYVLILFVQPLFKVLLRPNLFVSIVHATSMKQK